MKNLISFLIIILFSTITLSQSQTQSQTQVKEKTQKVKSEADKQKAKTNTDEFATLIPELYESWNTLKPANAAKYYAQDPGLVFYDVLPMQYKGWKAYENGVVTLLQDFSAFKLLPNKDLAVTRKGKVAWTTLTFHLSAKQKNGTAMELDGRHTAIWEKTKGKWLIVHEHVSAPLPSGPTK